MTESLETEDVIPKVNDEQFASFVLDKLKELESRISEFENFFTRKTSSE